MSPLITAQFMASAAFFTLALMHALVWARRPGARSYLLFALTATAAGANAIAEAWVYRAVTIEAMATALKFYVATSGFWALALIWFVVAYTGVGRIGRWLAIAVSLELVVALFINFWASASFIYTELTGLRRILLPWGEVISLAEGVPRFSFPLMAEATLLAITAVVVAGCRCLCREGHRYRAWLFGTTVITFLILFATHATLVDTGTLDSPYLSTYGFLGVFFVIGYEMAREVARASELSQEVQQKEADLLAAVDEERSRIASDLHDSVTQTLFSTAAIADALPDVWDRYPDEARRGLEELRQLTKGALAEMRTLLLELHPATLLERRLDELLQQLADATAARTRMPVLAEIAFERRLPDDVQVALYRVAQEALNNVIKHARAASAKLLLTHNEDMVTLSVSDDGQGFDPEANTAGCLGLRIMHDRVRSIGGEVHIDTRLGEGTTIKVTWNERSHGDTDVGE